LKKTAVNGDAPLPLIGQKAPSFEAVSSSGSLCFPETFAGNWVVLFSHTKSFNTSSTSDFAAIREVGDEFRKNGCALVDLYCGDYERYLDRFRALKEQAFSSGMERFDVQFVLVDDGLRSVTRNYGICGTSESFHEEVSSFFVIDPSSVIRTILMYHPDNVSRAFDDLLRIVIALRKNDELHNDGAFRQIGAGLSVPMHIQNRVALAF
jgi:Peroxiredoxin